MICTLEKEKVGMTVTGINLEGMKGRSRESTLGLPEVRSNTGIDNGYFEYTVRKYYVYTILVKGHVVKE